MSALQLVQETVTTVYKITFHRRTRSDSGIELPPDLKNRNYQRSRATKPGRRHKPARYHSMSYIAPNLREWTSAPGVPFSDALSDYLLQLDVRNYNRAQRKMIWDNATQRQQARQAKWHGPTPPYDLETEENSARLCPTFTYNFNKRGDCWTFSNFRFSDTWKVDPDTGNIVLPNVHEWSKIMDKQNHYRQAQGWPLIVARCEKFLYGDGVCDCGQCPDAPSHKRPRSTPDGPLRCFEETHPADVVESTPRPRKVRFLVSSAPQARVQFLLNTPESSTDADSFSEDRPSPPRKSSLKSILKRRATSPTEEQAVNTTPRPRVRSPPGPRLQTWADILTGYLQHRAQSPETQPIDVPIRDRVQDPIQCPVQGTPETTSLLAEAMATSLPNTTTDLEASSSSSSDLDDDDWYDAEDAGSDLSDEDYVSLFHDDERA